MKMITAHVPHDALEPVRRELLGLGVFRMSMAEVHSSAPDSMRTVRYRGADLHTHTRPELRIECVATARQAAAVVDALRGHASGGRGLGGIVAVVELDQLHEVAGQGDVYADDPRVDLAV